jgi:dolichyl-phosphate-mannose-protein mannosyltransferase
VNVAIRRVAARVAALPLALRVTLLAIAVLHAVGLSWGLPASESWDNDGVAPRDFLPGLAATFTPGKYYTYPPLQLALLALLTAPVTLVAVARAGTTALAPVLREILSPAYMTAMAMTARIVCLLMSLGLVLALAKIAEEIAPPERRERAAVGTAIAAGVGVPFTYYSHTSNLDVPYLFWTSLAALALVRTIARREPKRLRGALVFMALAVATKDQAYAVFLVGAPVVLVAWVLLDAWPRKNLGTIAKHVLVGAAIAAVLLAVIDGAVTNPSGFRARLAFLSGPASQDYATYSRDLAGRIRLVLDLGRELKRHHPTPFFVLYIVGFVVAMRRSSSRAAALAPLALVTSFTLCFNLVARRVEERFTLPQVLFLSVYAGIALAWVTSLPQRGVRVPATVACAGLLLWSLWGCLQLDVNILYDPRYATEAFLAREAREKDTIEVQGLNVYLPRLPSGARVVRAGPTPPESRGPIPGVEEIQAPLMDIEARRPRFVVVSECYFWRFYVGKPSGGRIRPAVQQHNVDDEDASRYFDGLFHERFGYAKVHESRFEGRIFERANMHASVGCPVYVFERKSAP